MVFGDGIQILSNTQCRTTLSEMNLNDKCKWYNDGCKTKWDLLTSSECGIVSRTDDCVEMKAANGGTFSKCYDKVYMCLCVNVYIFIFMYEYVYVDVCIYIYKSISCFFFFFSFP
jgi:hypothetical protein